MLLLKILGALGALLLLCVLFLLVCNLLVDPRKAYTQDSPFYRGILNVSAAVIVRLGRVRLQVSGLEQLPADNRKMLLVCNHRSNFDPIVTLHALRRQNIAFISKPENFRIPLYGRMIRKCCFLPIDRENPRNAITTIRQAAQLLEGGQVSVCVYPEGTRSKNAELLPFHNGVFKIAQRADAPIVVLTVDGTEHIHKNFLLRPTQVRLSVAAVIPAQEVSRSRTEMLGTQIQTIITESLQRGNHHEHSVHPV